MKQSVIKKANKALYTRVAAGIGGSLAAALSLGLSLYATRTSTEIARIAPGTPIKTGQWEVALASAETLALLPNGSHVTDGKRALAIDLTIKNLTAESSNLYFQTLKLDNIPNAPVPQFYLMRDKELLWDLQPMMPETVKAVWELPATETLPKVLNVTVIGTTYKAKDNLYSAPGWFNPTDVARVSLPVTAAAGGATP